MVFQYEQMTGLPAHCRDITQIDGSGLLPQMMRGDLPQNEVDIFNEKVGGEQDELTVVRAQHGTVVTDTQDELFHGDETAILDGSDETELAYIADCAASVCHELSVPLLPQELRIKFILYL